MTVLCLQRYVFPITKAQYTIIIFCDLMLHFGNYAVPSWHHLRMQNGRWSGILHNWNIRAQGLTSAAAIKPSYANNTGTCCLTWHTCRNIAGYVGSWLGIQPSDRDRKNKAAAFFVVTPNWDIGWNTRRTRKRGWHLLTRSTTSAWPKVK